MNYLNYQRLGRPFPVALILDPTYDMKLDIIVADGEGMFYLILQFYLVDFMSVLEYWMIHMTRLTEKCTLHIMFTP